MFGKGIFAAYLSEFPGRKTHPLTGGLDKKRVNTSCNSLPVKMMRRLTRGRLMSISTPTPN